MLDLNVCTEDLRKTWDGRSTTRRLVEELQRGKQAYLVACEECRNLGENGGLGNGMSQPGRRGEEKSGSQAEGRRRDDGGGGKEEGGSQAEGRGGAKHS